MRNRTVTKSLAELIVTVTSLLFSVGVMSDVVQLKCRGPFTEVIRSEPDEIELKPAGDSVYYLPEERRSRETYFEEHAYEYLYEWEFIIDLDNSSVSRRLRDLAVEDANWGEWETPEEVDITPATVDMVWKRDVVDYRELGIDLDYSHGFELTQRLDRATLDLLTETYLWYGESNPRRLSFECFSDNANKAENGGFSALVDCIDPKALRKNGYEIISLNGSVRTKNVTACEIQQKSTQF